MTSFNDRRWNNGVVLGKKVQKQSWLMNKLKPYPLVAHPDILIRNKTIERPKIATAVMPIMNEGEEIVIAEQNVYSKILNVSAGTDGNIYYRTSYVTDVIDMIDITGEKLESIINRGIITYVTLDEDKRIKIPVDYYNNKHIFINENCDDITDNAKVEYGDNGVIKYIFSEPVSGILFIMEQPDIEFTKKEQA